MIALGVGAIGMADIAPGVLGPAGLTAAGVGLLIATVAYDGRARHKLLPKGAGDLATIPGAGYAGLFAIIAASIGYSVYGPAILQTLGGLSALNAGYVIALEAISWTVCGLLVSSLSGRWPGRMIRAGGVCAAVGIALSAVVFPTGSVLGAGVAGIIMGGGFGLSSSFISQRMLAAMSDAERGIGAGAIATVRLTGNAAGAAMAAVAANLVGLSAGLTEQTARAAGLWVFAAMLPVALLGVASMWRLGGMEAKA